MTRGCLQDKKKCFMLCYLEFREKGRKRRKVSENGDMVLEHLSHKDDDDDNDDDDDAKSPKMQLERSF